MLPSRHIAVAIERTPHEVYAFAVRPQNLPKWAAGLAGAIDEVAGEWVARSPMGEVKVLFAAPNTFGVLDHVVTLPNGEAVLNPMRVVANGAGSEVVFTLFRRPGMSDEEFEADARAVRADLLRLKGLMEERPRSPDAQARIS